MGNLEREESVEDWNKKRGGGEGYAYVSIRTSYLPLEVAGGWTGGRYGRILHINRTYWSRVIIFLPHELFSRTLSLHRPTTTLLIVQY